MKNAKRILLKTSVSLFVCFLVTVCSVGGASTGKTILHQNKDAKKNGLKNQKKSLSDQSWLHRAQDELSASAQTIQRPKALTIVGNLPSSIKPSTLTQGRLGASATHLGPVDPPVSLPIVDSHGDTAEEIDLEFARMAEAELSGEMIESPATVRAVYTSSEEFMSLNQFRAKSGFLLGLVIEEQTIEGGLTSVDGLISEFNRTSLPMAKLSIFWNEPTLLPWESTRRPEAAGLMVKIGQSFSRTGVAARSWDQTSGLRETHLDLTSRSLEIGAYKPIVRFLGADWRAEISIVEQQIEHSSSVTIRGGSDWMSLMSAAMSGSWLVSPGITVLAGFEGRRLLKDSELGLNEISIMAGIEWRGPEDRRMPRLERVSLK